MAKAKILLHPTLLQSPSSIEVFQRRHGLRVVLGDSGPTVIPAILPRHERAQRADTGCWGGDAA